MPEGDAGLSRRTLLQRGALGAGALALPGLLSACGSDPATGPGGQEIDSDVVVYGYFGGDFGAAQKRIMFDTYAQEYGVRVSTPATDFARFRMMGERGDPVWDATDADNFIAVEWMDLDILQPLPQSVARCDLIEEQYRDRFGGCYFFSYAQGYKTETFPDGGPQNWADFWDTSRFPGKRGWPRDTYFPGVMEAALMADGADKDSLYPIDIDRALAKLDEIRDDLLFYESYGQGAQYLAQDSVSLVFDPVSRIYSVGEAGTPTEIVWNEAILTYSASPVIANAPNEDAIFALVDWMNDPERQAELAVDTLNAPSVEAAFEFIPDDVLPNLANSEEHTAQAATIDTAKLSEQYTEIAERYGTWLAS